MPEYIILWRHFLIYFQNIDDERLLIVARLHRAYHDSQETRTAGFIMYTPSSKEYLA